MRKTREILRQKWELGRTHREVAASVSSRRHRSARKVAELKAAGQDIEDVEWKDVRNLLKPRLRPAGEGSGSIGWFTRCYFSAAAIRQSGAWPARSGGSDIHQTARGWSKSSGWMP